MRAQALLALLVLMPQAHLLSSARILKRASVEPRAADLGEELCGNCGGKDELQGVAKKACQICMKVQHEREQLSKDANAEQVAARLKAADAGAALAQVHRLSSGNASLFDGLWFHQKGPKRGGWDPVWQRLNTGKLSITDGNGNGKSDFHFPGGDKIIFQNVSGVLSHGKILWANGAVWVKQTSSVSMQDVVGRWYSYTPSNDTVDFSLRVRAIGDSATLSQVVDREDITMVNGRPTLALEGLGWSYELFHVGHSKDELVWMDELVWVDELGGLPDTWRSWALQASHKDVNVSMNLR